MLGEGVTPTAAGCELEEPSKMRTPAKSIKMLNVSTPPMLTAFGNPFYFTEIQLQGDNYAKCSQEHYLNTVL